LPDGWRFRYGSPRISTTPKETAMEKLWYYAVNGTDHKGPVSDDELRQLQLPPATLVWRQGMSRWAPLSSIQDFQQSSTTPASPATIINISPPPTGTVPRTNGLAVASMVLGIVGLVFGSWCCIGLILPVLAIIFGHVAYSQINCPASALSGKGMAIAGFVLGYVSIMINILIYLIYGALLLGPLSTLLHMK